MTEAQIRAHNMLGLPNEFVFPAYHDRLTLMHAAHTVAAALGAPLPNSAPYNEALFDGNHPAADRVVLFIVDGLGLLHLRRVMDEDANLRSVVDDLGGVRATSSVAPTITNVALTSFWTGLSPAANGIVGTNMVLRRAGGLANLLYMRTLPGRQPLIELGLRAEDIVNGRGLAEHFADHNIPTHLFSLGGLMKTALSNMVHRGVSVYHSTRGYADLFPRFGDVLAETRGQRCFVSGYWPGVDSLSHEYGARSREIDAEVRAILTGLRNTLLSPGAGDGRTLVMILADHGQRDITRRIDLNTDPEAKHIRDKMLVGLSGNRRLAVLHLLPGTREEVREAVESAYGDALYVVDADAALEAGLYGPGPYAPRTRARLGDLVLVARRGVMIEDSAAEMINIVGMHGGLDEDEMLTPLLWRMI